MQAGKPNVKSKMVNNRNFVKRYIYLKMYFLLFLVSVIVSVDFDLSITGCRWRDLVQNSLEVCPQANLIYIKAKHAYQSKTFTPKTSKHCLFTKLLFAVSL